MDFDVLIAGGGPVGLLTASEPGFGRRPDLYCRTAE